MSNFKFGGEVVLSGDEFAEMVRRIDQAEQYESLYRYQSGKVEELTKRLAEAELTIEGLQQDLQAHTRDTLPIDWQEDTTDAV